MSEDIDMNEVLQQAAEQDDATGRAARWWQEQIRSSITMDKNGIRCVHRTRSVSIKAKKLHYVCLACGAESDKELYCGD